MKKLLLALAGVSALALPSVANAQQAQITDGSIVLPVPGSNDFQTQLASVGLTAFTAGTGTNITLTGPATLVFTYMGSESGFRDNFTATSLSGPIFYQELSTSVDNQWPGGGTSGGIPIGSGLFAGGSLSPYLLFSSLDAGAIPSMLGSFGFGVFLPNPNSVGYTTNTFYLGYDDQAANPDDNHDDIIIRVQVLSPVPEPATWAMMLIGFAAIGVALRRRRKAKAISQLA